VPPSSHAFHGHHGPLDPAVTDGLPRARSDSVRQCRRLEQLRRCSGLCRGDGSQRDGFHQRARLKQVDILGFSIGGLVAQEITLQAPDFVAAWCWSARTAKRESMIPVRGKANRSSARPMTSGRSVASCSLHAVGSEPSGRTQISQALSASLKDRDPEVTEKPRWRSARQSPMGR